ncbi:hypothetical protein GCM10022393_37600 [Aquimarina addita]|uniref:Gliding motility-associated C-terminal domain-containing protein n=1 Tax=Aquimarina addita TaxID=870485 RepID=A0ABP6URS5_9FLAO
MLFFCQSLFSQSVQLTIKDGAIPALCSGSPIQIQAEVMNPQSGRTYTYNWTNTTNSQFIKSAVGDEGTYVILIDEYALTQTSMIQVEVFGGDATLVQTIEIVVENSPNPGFSSDLLLCNKTGTINLFDSLKGVDIDDTGTWSPPLANGHLGTFVVGTDAVGEYKYLVTGNAPCNDGEAIIEVKECFDNDFDNDGVDNDRDLDDDNDGILDSDENDSCAPSDLTESRPVKDIHFGTGNTFIADENIIGHNFITSWPDDGQYTVANSLTIFNSDSFDIWFMATDINPTPHIDGAGTNEGRYLAVNIKDNFIDEVLYELTDIPIVGNIPYNFRIDIAGLCDRPGVGAGFCEFAPKLDLQIIDQNAPLGSPPIFETTSDIIGVANDDIWRRLELPLTVTANTLLTLRITNQQVGGATNTGNDIGIDNIRFAPLECDFDKDLVPNYLDLDSDNDGIYDIVEAGYGHLDVDGDGMVDGALVRDVDANGVPRAAAGGLTPLTTTTGIPDYLNLDSDNDLCSDANEAYFATDADGGDTGVYGEDPIDFSTIVNQNGLVITAPYTPPADSDMNMVDDYIESGPDQNTNGTSDACDAAQDLDSDDDGILDSIECPLATARDSDQDGILDCFDLDSDNDGIYDVVEVGHSDLDLDNDGIVDGAVSVDGIPIAAGGGFDVIDTDADLLPDYIDIDADADGIQDIIEGQSTNGYIPPSGVDSDMNGVDDIYQGASAIEPVDTDADGSPDYIDNNSDNDCFSDTIEAYDINQDGIADIEVITAMDTDNDGLDEVFDRITLTMTTAKTNPIDGGELPTDLPDNQNPGVDVDFREEYLQITEPLLTMDICEGDVITINLFDQFSLVNNTQGVWTGPSGLTNGSLGTFDPSLHLEGLYTYTLPALGSCPAGIAEVMVNLIPALETQELTLALSNGTFAENNNIIATVDGSGAYEYSLDGGVFQENNVFADVSLGLHTVTVSDIYGCSSISKEIFVIGFPKFFTPNNDGANDFWNVIADEELPDMSIFLFDKYGKLLAQLSPDGKGWDGTYNGRDLPSSDYWFAATLEDGSEAYRGHFSLVR